MSGCCEKCGQNLPAEPVTTREKIEYLKSRFQPEFGIKALIEKLVEILLELEARPTYSITSVPFPSVPTIPWQPYPNPSPNIPYVGDPPYDQWPKVICANPDGTAGKTVFCLGAANSSAVSDATGHAEPTDDGCPF